MAKCHKLISKSNANEPYRIGALAADDFVRSKYPTAKLLHPEDIEISGSKPGDFDMVYEVEDPPPGEIIVVEAKGGNSPLGSRKIGNEAYQQGTSKYAAAIIYLMSEKGFGTTERRAGNKIKKAAYDGTPIKYLHVQTPINDDVDTLKVRELSINKTAISEV